MIGVSALGSSSRGAMLGLLTVCLLWLSKVPGKQKVLAALAIGFFGVIALTIMPESWWDRMNSVKTYDKDASAMGRINAWWCAFNLAKDRLTGGGFEFNTPTAFALYAPDPNDIHAAHSIYFQVLGDHGFVGIGLFLLIAVSTWLLLAKIVKRTTNNPDFLWANQMARFIQLSLAAYYVAGAFLSLAYYDLYWQLIAVSVVLNTLTKSSVPLEKPAMISADKTQSRVPEIRGAFVRMN
jgi:probable O-glycosylation ligase (exosortase A-associated)